MLPLGHGTVCFMSVELGAFVLLLRLFFVKNCAVILVGARESGSRALTCEATWGCRSSVARKLPPVLCGSGTGPGLSRARSLGHSLLTTGSLVLGPVFRSRSPTLHLIPMGCHGWGFVFVSMLRTVICIISWIYWVTFLRNLSFLLR